MEREEFINTMGRVAYYYNRDMDTPFLEFYFKAFEDVPLEVFKDALTRHMKTSGYFPQIHELQALLYGTEEEKKTLAWGFVVDNLRRASSMTGKEPAPEGAHETIALMGGWFKAGMWKEAHLEIRRREFFESFTTEKRMHQLGYEPKPIGLSISNVIGELRKMVSAGDQGDPSPANQS